MQHLTDPPVEPESSHATPEALSSAATVDLAIAGMGCRNCANRIRNVLLEQPGVLEAELEVARALARVWYDPSRTGVREILSTVDELGERTQHQFLAVALRGTSTDADGR